MIYRTQYRSFTPASFEVLHIWTLGCINHCEYSSAFLIGFANGHRYYVWKLDGQSYKFREWLELTPITPQQKLAILLKNLDLY